MRNRFVVVTAVVFVVAIMITIPYSGFILTPTSLAAQTQQMNSNTSSLQGTPSSYSSNPLTLNSIFKQVNNSVVQITSKTPTAGVANSSNQSSSNGTGFGIRIRIRTKNVSRYVYVWYTA